MSSFVLVLVGLLVSVAAFVLWLELLIRAAAVYVAVLFLPLALATLVWPSVSHWCRRLVETLAALILSKFVIVATLSLAAGAVSSGTAGSGNHGAGFASVLAGGALLVLATFVPFSILRLIPLVEAGAVGHLDGLRQRATSTLMQAPRTAASFALKEGMAAAGGALLSAQSGPAGTGDVVGGGGGNEDLSAQVNSGNGGLIPDANGMMVGDPESQAVVEAGMARGNAMPASRGPKPIMGGTGGDEESAARASGGTSGAVSESPRIIGTAHPGHKRYYFGRDDSGPVLKWLPPSEPLPEKYRAARSDGAEGA
jgi:hypothetical protein